MTSLMTPTCELLGISRPIVQAPVSAVPEVVAGVSNAGGLGIKRIKKKKRKKK